MSEPVKIRCSALPRVWACPASAAPSNVKSESPESRLGQIVHAHIAGKLGFDSVRREAANIGRDADEAAYLYSVGLEADKELVDNAGMILVRREDPLEFDGGGVVLTGSPDVWGMFMDRERAQVVDYKTGRVDRDHDQQLRGYAFLVLAAMPEAEEYKKPELEKPHDAGLVRWQTAKLIGLMGELVALLKQPPSLESQRQARKDGWVLAIKCNPAAFNMAHDAMWRDAECCEQARERAIEAEKKAAQEKLNA